MCQHTSRERVLEKLGKCGVSFYTPEGDNLRFQKVRTMIGRLGYLLIAILSVFSATGLRGESSSAKRLVRGRYPAEKPAFDLSVRKFLAAAVEVRHLDRHEDGYAVAETANFQIFHNQKRDLVDRVAQAAEASRAGVSRKWFGEAHEAWRS